MKKLKYIALMLLLKMSAPVWGQTFIYVSPNGSGTQNGADAANAFNPAEAGTFISNYSKNTAPVLNVVFVEAGTYQIPNKGWTISKSNDAVNGLTVNFYPLNPTDSVVLSGQGNISSRFLQMGKDNSMYGTANSFLTVNISNLTISDFSSTSSEPGERELCLFNMKDYYVLNLNNVLINNIGSIANPLVYETEYCQFNAKGCTFANITNFTEKEANSPVVKPEKDQWNFSFDSCKLLNWRTNCKGAYSDIFRPSVGGYGNLIFRNCLISGSSSAVTYFSNQVGGYVNITFDNTIFENNEMRSAKDDYSGYFLLRNGTLTLNKSIFRNNTLTAYGRKNIFFDFRSGFGAVNIFGCQFSDNRQTVNYADYSDDNVHFMRFDNAYPLTIDSSTFSNNTLIINNTGNESGTKTGDDDDENYFFEFTGTMDVTFKNSCFTGNVQRFTGTNLTAANTGTVSFIHAENDNIAFYRCNFDLNTLETLNSNRTFLDLSATTAPILTRNTFSRTIGAETIVRLPDDKRVIVVNNTFSNNFGANTAVYYHPFTGNVSWSGIVNNTFHKSGNIRYVAKNDGHFSCYIAQNLFFGDESKIDMRLDNGTPTDDNIAIERNVFGDRYYLKGCQNDVGYLPKPTLYYMDENLTYDHHCDPGYHAIKFVSDSIPVLRNGLKPTGDGIGFADSLNFDQRGIRRPDEMSFGAYDRIFEHGLRDNRLVILYDPEQGLEPSYRVEITNDVTVYSRDIIPKDVLWENCYASDTQPGNGRCVLERDTMGTGPSDDRFWVVFYPDTRNSGGKLIPQIGTVGKPFPFTYSVTVDGLEKKADVFFIIINVGVPSGVLDDMNSRCSAPLADSIAFNPQLKFDWWHANGYHQSGSTGNKWNLDGMSIPLVGDLNGDGLPEIVALGLDDALTTNTGTTASGTYVYVIDGQNGKTLSRTDLGIHFELHDGTNGTHSSPSQLAIADVDGNGKAEIIVALGWLKSNNSRRQMRCYTVNPSSFALTQKWETTVPYNAYNVTATIPNGEMDFDDKSNGFAGWAQQTTPVPQIVKLNFSDNDGKPYILIYNKIYDAQTGELKVVLEDLGDADSWNQNTLSTNNKIAYIGRNRAATFKNDIEQNFSAVYDVDCDGTETMDVIAGGKVYYDINPLTGTYAVKSADSSAWNLNIGDGFTAVGDIDMDGIPDIVVAKVDGSNLHIKVWDPGMMQIVNGIPQGVPDKKNHAPTLKANISVPCSLTAGTHSHVFIGDIDGKVTNGQKLPEITIMIDGFIKGWTWNANGTSADDRLMLSFSMPHDDPSHSGGLSFFDFNGDGIHELVIRDKNSIKVVSAAKKETITAADLSDKDVYLMNITTVAVKETGSNINISSATGYEYPVVADVDGDGAAELVVMASRTGTVDDARGNVFVISAPPGAHKWAAAPTVWNQYHYHPLKINEDMSLPKKYFNPLSFIFPDINGIPTAIFNFGIMQIAKSSIASSASLEARTPTADLHFDETELVVETFPYNHAYIRFVVRNLGDATASAATPIKIYRDSVPNGLIDTLITLADDTLFSSNHYYPGKDLYPYDPTLDKPVKEFIVPIRWEDRFSKFIIRLADDTHVEGDSVVDEWTDDVRDDHWSDCNWVDNITEVGSFSLRSDAFTVVQGETATLDILANDKYPHECFSSLNVAMFTLDDGSQMPMSGDSGTFVPGNRQLTYTAPIDFDPGILKLKYTLSCHVEDVWGKDSLVTQSADIYIFIVQSAKNDLFMTNRNYPYTIELKQLPFQTEFSFYESKTARYPSNVYPDDWPTIPRQTDTPSVWVQPFPPAPYKTITFPRAEIKLKYVGTGDLYLLPNIGNPRY